MKTASSVKYLKLIFLVLFLFNSSAKGQDICIINVEAMPLRMLDKVPVYPGCENTDNNEEMIHCLDEKIHSFFEDNFQISKNSNSRIIIQLNIDINGCIDKIRVKAKTSAIEKEAVRVAGLLPQMTPGYIEDKRMVTNYTFIFKFDE